MHFRFASPWLLLIALLALAVLRARPRRGGAEFGAFPLVKLALVPSRGPAVQRALIALAIVGLALACARPQYGREVVERGESGRDVMLVLDLSPSMRADDLLDRDGSRRDRLSAVIGGAEDFVKRRPNDRIGLVFFAGNALTSCPLTTDHDTVIAFLQRTEKQQRLLWRENEAGILGDGTNIGLGLGDALRGLTDPRSKGRAIVLITDGIDTRQLPNWIDPLAAARHANDLHVKVHCIGVGNPQGTYTATDPLGRVFSQRISRDLLPDLGRLKSIASLADGIAATASDVPEIDRILARIDALEPSERTVETREDYADRYRWPLAAAAATLALALALEPRLRGVA